MIDHKLPLANKSIALHRSSLTDCSPASHAQADTSVSYGERDRRSSRTASRATVRFRSRSAPSKSASRCIRSCHNHYTTMPEIAEKAQDLFEIKGVLTKFMRMLFPLEFRIDSIANSGPMLPFHYPLLPGEMIYLPERLEPFGTRGDAYIYYFVTTAHLAGAPRLRHLQAQARRYCRLRRARRDRRRGDRQLRRVVRRSRPRGRPDAAGGVGANRRRACASLSRTRTAHRGPQSLAAR